MAGDVAGQTNERKPLYFKLPDRKENRCAKTH